MSFTQAYASSVINHILGGPDLTRSATVYAALFTAAPGGGSAGTEVSGGSYARVSITNNDTNWPAATNGLKSNGTTITWPTASADWGTVVAVGLFDASTAGNLLMTATLSPTQAVPNGVTVSFAVGELDFTLSSIDVTP